MADVPGNLTEAVTVGVPLGLEPADLGGVPPDQVPPHHHLLGERRTAEQDELGRSFPVVQPQDSGTGAGAGQFRAFDVTPSTVTVPESTRTPCSKLGSTVGSRDAPGFRRISAPTGGVKVCTGDVSPRREPSKARASPPSKDTAPGAWWSKRRGPRDGCSRRRAMSRSGVLCAGAGRRHGTYPAERDVTSGDQFHRGLRVTGDADDRDRVWDRGRTQRLPYGFS